MGLSARGRGLGDLGQPRTLFDAERNDMLHRLFPGVPDTELEPFTVRVTEYGSEHLFVIASRSPVYSLAERVAAAKRELSSIDHAAAIEKNGMTYVLIGNLCDPGANEGFEAILNSMRFW
jgi:hypothetical protein